MEFAAFGPLTSIHARTLYRINWKPSWPLVCPLEGIGLNALWLSTRKRVSGNSYHWGRHHTTVLYHTPYQIVLCQQDRPLKGVFIGEKDCIRMLKEGIVELAKRRREVLLCRHEPRKLDRMGLKNYIENFLIEEVILG